MPQLFVTARFQVLDKSWLNEDCRPLLPTLLETRQTKVSVFQRPRQHSTAPSDSRDSNHHPLWKLDTVVLYPRITQRQDEVQKPKKKKPKEQDSNKLTGRPDKDSAGDSGRITREMELGLQLRLSLHLPQPQPLIIFGPPPCSPRGSITTAATTTTTTASSSVGCVAVATDLASLRTTGLFLSYRRCPCTSISSSPPQNSALGRARQRLLSPRRPVQNCYRHRPHRRHSLESLQATRRCISVKAASTAFSPAQRLHTLPRDPIDQLNTPP